MSDQMAQVGREVWKVNMVGTVLSNRTGGGKLGKVALKAKEILKGSADSLLYQHSTLPLAYAIWADNNFVKTLSNFHTPCIVEDGVKRKRKNKQGRRDQYQTSVPIPSQTKDYCETYHLIDKGNGREAKFWIGGGSKKHGWSPKLAARLFNMNLNNAYKIYTTLYAKHHPGCKPMEMRDCVIDLTHSLLQQGQYCRTIDLLVLIRTIRTICLLTN